jgi:hypothetical protein
MAQAQKKEPVPQEKLDGEAAYYSTYLSKLNLELPDAKMLYGGKKKLNFIKELSEDEMNWLRGNQSKAASELGDIIQGGAGSGQLGFKKFKAYIQDEIKKAGENAEEGAQEREWAAPEKAGKPAAAAPERKAEAPVQGEQPSEKAEDASEKIRRTAMPEFKIIAPQAKYQPFTMKSGAPIIPSDISMFSIPKIKLGEDETKSKPGMFVLNAPGELSASEGRFSNIGANDPRYKFPETKKKEEPFTLGIKGYKKKEEGADAAPQDVLEMPRTAVAEDFQTPRAVAVEKEKPRGAPEIASTRQETEEGREEAGNSADLSTIIKDRKQMVGTLARQNNVRTAGFFSLNVENTLKNFRETEEYSLDYNGKNYTVVLKNGKFLATEQAAEEQR